MAEPSQAAAALLQEDMRLVADLAAQFIAAKSEAEVYQGLAEGLQRVVGGDSIVSVSHYDPRRGAYRPRALVGLGPFAEAVSKLLGADPRDLAADFPAPIKQAMAGGRLVRVEGGVGKLAESAIPEVVLRQGASLLGLVDAYVVGFAKADFRGGACLITRRAGVEVRGPTVEALARIAAVAIEGKRTEERYRSVIDNIGEGLGQVDLQERFVWANRAAEEIFGVPSGTLVGRSLSEFVDPPTFARMRELTEGRNRGERSSYPFELRRPDGTVRAVTVTTSSQYDLQGRLLGSYGVFRDITDRKKAEEDRARLESELQQAQKMESVGRLAGGVAHDFNNMLGVILAHADVAMTEVDPNGQVHNDLSEIRKAALRSASLTRQLLAFARRQVVSPRVLDLNQTIAEMLKMLQRLIGEDIALQWKPGEGLWPVKVDPSQIDQILANLCVNSRDAISGVGRLTIETGNCTFDEAWCAAHAGAIPGEVVRLAVSDDGCGMDKQTLSHLFEPFFTTKGVGKGTGLGLATVYGIVKQNHGYVDACSEPGRGTTFNVYFPRHQGDSRKAAAGAASDTPACGHETILLVEDEPAILYAVKKMLEKLGYQVLTAGSAAEALKASRDHDGDVDLLMTDVVMPEMNGRELARKLSPIRPEMKLLFMSGYTASVIAHHGVLDEGMHFIQKPFSAADLAAKVRAALDGQGG